MTATCLLRNVSDKLCEPSNALYVGLQGIDGNGGRAANVELPADYKGILLSDSPVAEAQSKVHTSLASYRDSFRKQFEDVQESLRLEGQSENEIRIKSVYIYSEEPGTGKTTTASALLNEYLVTHYIGRLKRGVTPKQRPCYFLDINELQTKYTEFNRPKVPSDIAEKAAETYYRAIEKAKHTDFVVLDDIGLRESTEGWRADLHSVINHRVSNRMPTVYTSNVLVSELPDVFGEERLADRVRDMCQEIHFGGESKRGKRR